MTEKSYEQSAREEMQRSVESLTEAHRALEVARRCLLNDADSQEHVMRAQIDIRAVTNRVKACLESMQ